MTVLGYLYKICILENTFLEHHEDLSGTKVYYQNVKSLDITVII